MPRPKTIIFLVEYGDARLVADLVAALARALEDHAEYWFPGERRRTLVLRVEDPDAGKAVEYRVRLPASQYEKYVGLIGGPFLEAIMKLAWAPVD